MFDQQLLSWYYFYDTNFDVTSFVVQKYFIILIFLYHKNKKNNEMIVFLSLILAKNILLVRIEGLIYIYKAPTRIHLLFKTHHQLL